VKRQKAQGVGLHQNDVTKSLNREAFKKTLYTVSLNDKYREYQKKLVEGERMMTFLEFKESIKPVRRKKFRNSKSGPRK
jgi:hypothetical protein